MVSRETSIAEALDVLGLAEVAHPDAAGRLAQFAEYLATVGVDRGFVGPHEPDNILARHVLESIAVLTVVPRELWVRAEPGVAPQTATTDESPVVQMERAGGGDEGKRLEHPSPGLFPERGGNRGSDPAAPERPASVSAENPGEIRRSGRSATAAPRPDRVGRTRAEGKSHGDTAGALIVDVGSGAGLPGMAIACLGAGPTVLLESLGRRASFLRETSKMLGVDVVIVRARAESAGRGELRERGTLVLSRGLAELPVALELMLPFVRLGGCAVILAANAAAGDTTAEHAGGLRNEAIGEETIAFASRALGGSDPEWSQFEVPGAEERRWAMIVRKRVSTSPDYPRRAGVPRRRPLGG